MGILYIISLLALIIVFMLFKKTDKALNGLGIFGLGAVLILCYNVFICYVLNYFTIKCSLQNLFIVNIVIIILGIIYIVKTKKIQKYFCNGIDLICILVIQILTILIGYFQYGDFLEIKYETTDPAVHYRATQLFAENESLLNNIKDDIYNFRSFKIGAYVNSGILMMLSEGIIDEFNYYRIFILFDLIILFFIGYMLYFTFIKISNGKLKVLALLLSILCLLGYPLNSMLFGFEYLTVSLLIICTIINMVSYYKNKEIDLIQCIIIFFLLNFELFCTYYLFVPFMYSGLFIYFCIDNYKQDKKLFTKKTILLLLITLIIPFILGFIYHLKPDLYSENLIKYEEGVITSPVASVGGLVSEGYIYKNLYSNIILLIPLTIFVLVKEWRKLNFSVIMFVFLFGYISLLFIGLLFDRVSEYYIAKNYFPLWIILFYFNFKGLYYLYEKNKKAPYILVCIYLIILSAFFYGFKVGRVRNKICDISIKSCTEIYTINKSLIYNYPSDLYEWELNLLEWVRDNIDVSNKIEILGTEKQILWSYPILNYVNYDKEMDKLGHQDKLRYKHMNNKVIENADYIICFYRSDFYKDYDESLLENYEVLYENIWGKVIKRNI